MANILFNTLQCAERLVEAGVPDRQAKAQAQMMSEAFVHDFDKLVTKVQVNALEGGVNAKLNLLTWMVGLGFTVLIIPQLQAWFG